jgi:hypothetical protein
LVGSRWWRGCPTIICPPRECAGLIPPHGKRALGARLHMRSRMQGA